MKAKIELPDENLKAEHLRQLLAKEPQLSRTISVIYEDATYTFYPSGRLLICPPISDNPSASEGLPSILEIANALKNVPTNARESYHTLVFPVFEQQIYGRTVFAKALRQHWVTLVYDIHTNTATLFDPTGSARANQYKLNSLEKQLCAAFRLDEITINLVALDVQKWDPLSDKKVSGHWTFYIIQTLLVARNHEGQNFKSRFTSVAIDQILHDNRSTYRATHMPTHTPRSVQAKSEFTPIVSPLQDNEPQHYGELPVDRVSQFGSIPISRKLVFPDMEEKINPVNLVGDVDCESHDSQVSASNMLQWYNTLFLCGAIVTAIGLLCLIGPLAFVPPVLAMTMSGIGMLGMFGGAVGRCVASPNNEGLEDLKSYSPA